jgi:hypothetical protein
MENQGVTPTFPTAFSDLERSDSGRRIAAELRKIAGEVRRIGSAWRADPETICIQKDEISRRLIAAASVVERAA